MNLLAFLTLVVLAFALGWSLKGHQVQHRDDDRRAACQSLAESIECAYGFTVLHKESGAPMPVENCDQLMFLWGATLYYLAADPDWKACRGAYLKNYGCDTALIAILEGERE